MVSISVNLTASGYLNVMSNDKNDANVLGVLTTKQYVLGRKITSSVNLIVSLMGVVTNALNLTTFMKIRLLDSVTLTFFFLSLYDFGVTTATSSVSISQLAAFPWNGQEDQWEATIVDPNVTFKLGGNLALCLNEGSMIVTTYLAVQRCYCVALPLLFRNIFTYKRSVTFIGVCVTFTLLVLCALQSEYSVTGKSEAGRNESSLGLVPAPHRADIDPVLRTLDSAIALLSQVVLTICVVVTSVYLRRSVDFRKRNAHPGGPCPEVADARNRRATESERDSQTSRSRRRDLGLPEGQPVKSHEMQIMKSITLISVLFIVCNTPRHAQYVARWCFPEYDTFGQHSDIFFLVSDVQIFFVVLNAALNFFVYATVNTKFRETMVNICGVGTE